MKQLFTLLFLSFLTCSAFSSTITGYVFDKDINEQLVGTTIVLSPGTIRALSMLNGKYDLKNVPAGRYNLKVSYIGYKTIDTAIEVKANENITLNFYMVSNTSNLSVVRVSSKANGESERYAKRAEQRADNLVNIVSANAIAISPDVTVGNILQRVSGVSIVKGNNGDGQYIIIRGLDKRYNTTLVNGIKIPSPDNKDRFIPMDIFPADIIERIEVSKTLTPSMEGDASGGVVNVIMKTAPDHFRLEGNLSTGYDQLFFNRDFSSYNTSTINLRSPGEIRGAGVYAPISDFPYNNLVTTTGKPPVNLIASLTIGSRFLNNKLGAVFSGSYQSNYTGNNTYLLVQNATVGPAHSADSSMNQTFPESYTRRYSSHTDRSGLTSTIDYNFNIDNSISLFGTYLQLNDHRVRETDDLTLGNYSYNGYVGGFQIDRLVETRTQLQNIYSIIIHGKNKLFKGLTTDWSLVRSQAKQQFPDRAQFDVSQKISPNGSGIATSVIYDTTAVNKETRNWEHNTDKDLSAYLNFHYKTSIGQNTAIFSFGGLIRHKDRNNFANAYNLSAIPDPGSFYQKFTSIPEAKHYFLPSSDALGNFASNAGVYTFNENIQAGYGEVKYLLTDRLDVVFGVRVERTDQDYNSSQSATIAGKSAQFKYIDYLPSLNAKYSLADNQALRVSYFRSILRPAYADLIPYQDNTGFYSDIYPSMGNPNLHHSVIDNYDLRYEMFPKGLDEFTIGAFYKSIMDAIEYGFIQTGFAADLTLSPANFGTAHNYGLEVDFKKYFGDFGVSGNYTYTHSLINSTKVFAYIDPADNSEHSLSIDQPRPLQGQSANEGNFSFLYKNGKANIDAQLAMVYTGERIEALSIYKDLDTWEKGTLNLDLSAQKEFSKHYIFYIKVNNILNTPYELYIKQPNKAYTGIYKLPDQESPDHKTVEYDKFYARYSIGFRFKF